MTEFKGFDLKYRRYFSQLAERGSNPITIEQASTLLKVPHKTAKQILSRLTHSGWLFRIKQGLYIPVPPTIKEGEPFAEDPWVLANALFEPCYLGGWDAISYWNLTDQIFIHTFVYTQTPQKKSTQTYLGHTFIVHKIPKENFFGLKVVWKNNVKLKVTDPSRTVIDLLDAPQLFGGSSVLNEVFSEYLRSEHKDINLLVEYGLAMKNKAILKRLGFLLENEGLLTPELNTLFMAKLSPGKAKLIPSQNCPKLVTKWQLWVPESWKERKNDI